MCIIKLNISNVSSYNRLPVISTIDRRTGGLSRGQMSPWNFAEACIAGTM